MGRRGSVARRSNPSRRVDDIGKQGEARHQGRVKSAATSGHGLLLTQLPLIIAVVEVSNENAACPTNQGPRTQLP